MYDDEIDFRDHANKTQIYNVNFSFLCCGTTRMYLYCLKIS